MRISSFVRPMLATFAIALWCGVFTFVGSAAAQVTCTGTQTLIDGDGDVCESVLTSPGSSTATASDSPSASLAESSAASNGVANSNASNGSFADATATNSGKAGSVATNGSSAEADADTSGTADASAQDGSSSSADASSSSTADSSAQGGSSAATDASGSGSANATAAGGSSASAAASGTGTADATASQGSSASSRVTGNGIAFADAVDDSSATATVSTANGFACAYATDGFTAIASDTSAPDCNGPGAVVVSSAGSCGDVANSPCALELHNYFSNANTSGGQAFVYVTAPFEGDPTSTSPAVQEGETCAMIYVLDTHQALQACCGCPVTADGLLTLSISGNLAPTPLATGKLVHDGSIRIIPSAPNATLSALQTPPYEGCDAVTGVCCDPTALSTGHQLIPASKLLAWANHVQSTQITETQFESVAPTAAEVDNGLPATCADTVRLGSGQGICTCPSGG